jgi:peptide deformylase
LIKQDFREENKTMALRNILPDSEPTLRKRSRAVTEFNPHLHELLDDMRETLLRANGVGLAAPQVGVLRRAAIVVDTNLEDKTVEEQIIELINPEIIASSGEQIGPEGCLSLPNVFGLVTRPDLVKIKAQDRNGEWFEVLGKDLTARAFCHEVDHLNGIIFTDIAERILTEEELEELQHGDDCDCDDCDGCDGCDDEDCDDEDCDEHEHVHEHEHEHTHDHNHDHTHDHDHHDHHDHDHHDHGHTHG